METRQLARLTYEQAEDASRNGRITDAQFDAYLYVWRTSAPRFSDLAEEHSQPPTDEQVAAIVRALQDELGVAR